MEWKRYEEDEDGKVDRGLGGQVDKWRGQVSWWIERQVVVMC